MSEVSQMTPLEHQLESSKDLINRRQMVVRLRQNPDFRKLILEGFCRDEAARYVQESGDPALDASARADAVAMAQASGHLLRFLHVTHMMGAHAERTREELEEAIAEERAETEEDLV